MRSILSGLALLALAVLPAAAQQKPSVKSVDAAQKRTNAAICAKADADGDSYRPFVCQPRCDCLAPMLLQSTSSSCEEPSPGVFGIELFGPPGECVSGHCTSGGLQPPFTPCHLGGTCPAGTECVTSCFPIIGCTSSSCLM